MKIWVSNLDVSTTEDEIFSLFEEIGLVTSVTLNEAPDPDRDTYTALVEMDFEDEAMQAIRELNGERIDGRILAVKNQPPQFRSRSTEHVDLDVFDSAKGTDKGVSKRGLRGGESPSRKSIQSRRR